MKPKTQLLILTTFLISILSSAVTTKTEDNTYLCINEVQDLQTYIESTYLKAVKQFKSDNYPLIETGKFKVMVITKDNEYMIKESSFFKNMTANDIKEFIFVHHVETTQSLGSFTDHYGMITIKLK